MRIECSGLWNEQPHGYHQCEEATQEKTFYNPTSLLNNKHH